MHLLLLQEIGIKHDGLPPHSFELLGADFIVDLQSLSNSHRCSPSVCSFISKNLGIAIQSHRQDVVQVELLSDEQKIREVYNDDSRIKLFFQKSNTYLGNTANWGNTKGLDHSNYVSVVLNPTSFKAFEERKLIKINPTQGINFISLVLELEVIFILFLKID